MENVIDRNKITNFLLSFSLFGVAMFVWRLGFLKYKIFYEKEWLLFIFTVYSFFSFVNLFYRAILCFIYKPTPKQENFSPPISIIIPVYNEEKMIEKCLLSAINAKYNGKREIICVDDGSVDNTLKQIEKVQQRYPEVKVIKFRNNKGKRQAIFSAVKASTGEIIVTLDSDTIITQDALEHLVYSFKDNKVGAVTGAVKVFNKDDNLLTKMVGVRYIMAFDFYRASQSVIKTVMVCSGVLSAYRKLLLEKIMDDWINQKFLGVRCTYGDDRSLTNFFIKNGYDTVYNRNAIAYTVIPNTLKKLLKMLTRWNKSYIRESIVFGSFIFSLKEKRFKWAAIFDFFITNLIGLGKYPVLLFVFSWMFIHPVYIFKLFVLITMISLFFMLFYIKVERKEDFIYGILYSYFYILVLCWLLPYSLIRLKDNSWLTR